MKTNTQEPKHMGDSEGSPEREFHSNTGLPKKDRNISNKYPNPMPTRTQGITQTAHSKKDEGNNQDKSRVK